MVTDIELMIRLWLNPRTRSDALAMADANRDAAQPIVAAQLQKETKK